MSRLCSLASGLLLALVAVTNAEAANRKETSKGAEAAVREALMREAHGLGTERDRLLEEAASLAPDHAPVHWHRGYVLKDGQWIKADDVPDLESQDRRYRAYRARRDEAPNTIEAQWELAEWCRKRGLPDQERAHLTRVVEMDPNHLVARQRLGFRRVGRDWVLEQDLATERAQVAREQATLHAWAPKIDSIRRDLHEANPHKRQAAVVALRAVTDPEAVPALEAMLSGDSEEAALLFVEAVGNMQSLGATAALARHAVFSPSVNVRRAAALQLKSRHSETYVPGMLSLLSSPIVSRVELLRGKRGNFVYRQSFQRETQSQHEVLVVDRGYQRIARQGGDRRDSLARALGDLQLTAQAREQELARQNEQMKALNERVGTALAISTGQQQANATDWWQWWTAENEVYVEGLKPVQAQRQVERVAIVDRVPGSQGEPGAQAAPSSPPPTRRAYDCLAAGTPVWTSGGLVPIEQIRVGDVVLSQDPDSGELAYKPVLGTTLRPSGPLVRVTVGGERFDTSGGHLFWVSGEGWIKARQLRSGMEAHGVGGTANVGSVEAGPTQETHNLIVADFHTYFVGEGRLLCHDNTVREPTQAIVPGLVAE